MEKISNKEYRQMDGISRSELQLFRKSPKHYLYSKTQEGRNTPDLIFGAAAHKYILERESFFDEFAVLPECDKRTTKGKEIYNNFLLESEGKDIITQEEFCKILDMNKAIDEHPFARVLLTGEVEQSFFWTDSETGEAVKCRPDVITEWNGKKYIVDYKTTASCENGHFERSAKKYGYQLQSGMYREGVFQNTFDDYGFIFVAQEKSAPYCVRVYICDQSYIEAGYDEFRALLGLYHRCKAEGTFPSYEGFDNEYEILTEGE